MERQTRKLRVGRVAGRQCGLVARHQLAHLGIGDSQIQSWLRGGYLLPALPRVYAVGHAPSSIEAEMWAAVLYAGLGAMLSHATAAWWRGLIEYPPRCIHVSTTRDVKSRDRIVVHGRRRLERDLDRGLPLTTVAQTLLDLSAGGELVLVRRALAVLDYRRRLDPRALEAACGAGIPGSAGLRLALAHHMPQLAYANGPLEVELLLLCERYGIPLPRLNVVVHGVLVDAHWPQASLVAELDGAANHSSRAQRHRDRSRELILRAHGIRVVRYDWQQIHHQPEAVRDDLLAALGAEPTYASAASPSAWRERSSGARR
jgi:hypothetical protein